MRVYLLEIRNRIFLTFLTWLSIVLVCYLYKETLLFLVLQPNRFCESNSDFRSFYFIFTNVTELFSVYVQLILFITSQLTYTYIIYYHGFNFFNLALFFREYYLVSLFLRVSFFVFGFSILVTNYFIIPLTWDFFSSFQRLLSDKFINLHFEAKLNEYLGFYVALYNLCIIYFQGFTIIIFFLSFIHSNFMSIKKFRKLYYYFFIIFSTLISPPDVISQIIISLLLIISFEILTIVFILKSVLIRQPAKAIQNSDSKN